MRKQLEKQCNAQITPIETKTNIQHIQRDLRCILTQKCNYRCEFCHKEGCDGSEKNLLSAEDYAFLFSTARDALGIQQVTLSGGEPMMREDVGNISEKLHLLGAKITMVSNGSLIPKHPEVMKDIDVLNVSLHTTNQELYTTLTGSTTKVQDLINGIIDVHAHYPHLNIKLNSAMIHRQNTPNTEDFAYKTQLASKYGRKLKYIELSDPSIPGFVDMETFERELITSCFVKNHITARQHIYKKDDIELITGRVFCSEAKKTENPEGYCKQYNDIYITPDGYLSSCPINIKKISAYDAIVCKDRKALMKAFQESVDKNTKYACPFTS